MVAVWVWVGRSDRNGGYDLDPLVHVPPHPLDRVAVRAVLRQEMQLDPIAMIDCDRGLPDVFHLPLLDGCRAAPTVAEGTLQGKDAQAAW